MADNQSNISGDFEGYERITCILQEGAITYQASAYGIGGAKAPMVTVGAAIVKDDFVMLDVGMQNTYVACKGLPAVKKIAGAGPIIGRVVSNPKWVHVPSASKAYTDSDNADWGAILSGEWYRVATIEFFGASSFIPGKVMADGTNAIVVGASATIKYKVADAAWKYAASGGAGVINMHHNVAGTAGDLTTTLLMITGQPVSVA